MRPISLAHQSNRSSPFAWTDRDVAFYFKYALCTDLAVFPRPRDSNTLYTREQCKLSWSVSRLCNLYRDCEGDQRSAYRVTSKQSDDNTLTVRKTPDGYSPQPHPSGLRWPSGADPNSLTPPLPVRVETEDDILHIKELPDFDGRLGQADSELLLSYLTVPYLRLPLIVEVTEGRPRPHAHALHFVCVCAASTFT